MENKSSLVLNPEMIRPQSVMQEDLSVKVLREAELLFHGAAVGLVNHGVDSLREQPLTVVAAVGSGVAFSAAMKGPPVVRTPALLLGTVLTGKFLVDAASAVSECMPAFAETWRSASQFEKNKNAVARSIGPLAFDMVFAAVAGKLTAQGLRLGSRLMNDTRLNFEPFGFGRTLAYQHPGGVSGNIGFLAEKPKSAGAIFMSERDFLRPRIHREVDTYWGRRFRGNSHGSELKEIENGFTKEILLQMFEKAGNGSKVDGARKFLKEVGEIKPSLTLRLNESKPRKLDSLQKSESLTRQESIDFARRIIAENNRAYIRSLRDIPVAKTEAESLAMARKSLAEEQALMRAFYNRQFERRALREVKETEREGIAKGLSKSKAKSRAKPDDETETKNVTVRLGKLSDLFPNMRRRR